MFTATAAHAQLRGEPQRIVFSFAAGSTVDGMVRQLGESLQADLARPVIVENSVGASGRLGVLAIESAPADGSVLLFTPVGENGHSLAQMLRRPTFPGQAAMA